MSKQLSDAATALEAAAETFEQLGQPATAEWARKRAAEARAAADEMLEALQGVLRVADRKTVEFDAARAAIAKAEGKGA